jgi:hypothetical protein
VVYRDHIGSRDRPPSETKESQHMRSKNRNILLALVAVLAFGVVASASASAALPEFSSSKYPVKFEITGGGSVRLEDAIEPQGSCTKVAIVGGEITGAKTAKASYLRLSECISWVNDTNCESAGASPGEIKTGPLTIAPVYISKSKKEVALDLNYEEKRGTPPSSFVKFECGSAIYPVLGSVLTKITAINTKASSFTISLKSNAAGRQEPWQFENEKGEKVSAFPELELRAGNLNFAFEASSNLTFTTAREMEIEG